MIFSSKYLVPAAAFAAVASVAISAPAQALSLSGSIDYTGGAVTWSGSGSGATANYDFAFDVAQFSSTYLCEGDFTCPDSISFNNFSIVNGSVVEASLIDGIATSTPAGNVSFFLTGADASQTATGVNLGLSGYFAAVGDPQTVLGHGFFSSQLAVRQDGKTTLSGNLVTDVPTPAAVLPILASLFGAASKRKRDSEEA